MDTHLGQRLQESLGDAYVVERELGGGGMSRVFVAFEKALGRRVVVKLLPPDLAADISVERFRREIQVAAQLVHPNIVPLLSAGEADGLPFYTMPLVEGESLRTRLARAGPLEIDQALELARQIAHALDYAHRRGIIHRDVKPGNVLLHDERHALVTDFGIARALTQASSSPTLTEVGLALGTPTYMSPEQAAGERELDRRSDIYSLGCVIYEMLTGAPPYAGTTAHAVIVRHHMQPIPRASDARAGVPPGVADALVRAMAKDPEGRFPTARDFSRALESTGVTLPVTEAVLAKLPRKSIAVLPFANLSGDSSSDFFSDGITEDIITQIATIAGLKVISRTSAMRYKATTKDLTTIAGELGVAAILEGSVRRDGDALRITARLVDAAADEELWAERFDRRMEDVFAVQAEVAERIAEALDTRLSSAERARIFRPPTRDMEAYNLCLLGRHYWARYTERDLRTAIGYFEQAISRDPEFASAYVGLSEASFHLGTGYFNVRPMQAYSRTRSAADKAVQLEPRSADAQARLAAVEWWYDYDFAAARRRLEAAVSEDPNSASAHNILANVLQSTGRHDEAIAETQRARALDPLSYFINGNAALALYRARRYEEAVAGFRRQIELDRTLPMACAFIAFPLIQLGRFDEAINGVRAVRQRDDHSIWSVMLAYVCAATGREAEARRLLAELEARRSGEYMWLCCLAMAYQALGDDDVALDRLEEAYNDRGGWITYLGIEPGLDPLRRHPRFVELLRRVGLTGAEVSVGVSRA